MPVTRRQTAAVIDVNDFAVTSLPSGDGDSSGRGNLDRHAVGRIDILAFMIFEAPAAEGIAPASQAAFQFSHHGPD